nr:MAG TPA: YqeY-like protein [Crassvirales sp.]
MDIDKLITEARKNGNTTELEICQLIKAAFIENKHAKKPISEIEVLRKMIKEREKAVKIYQDAGRNDLAFKEANEITFIKMYLPATPTTEQIYTCIANLVKSSQLTIKDTKYVIGTVQTRYPTAEKSEIVKIFKSLL